MISKNGVALIILVVEAVLSSLGVEFEAGTVAKAVEGVVIAGSIILMVWNQYERKDINWFVFKR